MQYSPKLKKAMEEIKAIVTKYDIGAMVIIHTPDHSEYYMNISPSYSCAKHDGDTVRIKAKLKDFNGDKKAWQLKVTDTSNMLSLLGETGGRTALSILNVSKQLDKVVDAEHLDGDHTGHTQQNN
jgi:hypothetical protein